MPRRKHIHKLQYLAIAVIVATVGAFFFRHHGELLAQPVPTVQKKEFGYKPQDRQKLEEMIHQGAKDD